MCPEQNCQMRNFLRKRDEKVLTSSGVICIYPKPLVMYLLRGLFSENWQPHSDNGLVMVTGASAFVFRMH